MLIKAKKLKRGDHIATISLSWGGYFGHTEPKFILPYGVLAEINCSSCTFSILENGVISELDIGDK